MVEFSRAYNFLFYLFSDCTLNMSANSWRSLHCQIVGYNVAIHNDVTSTPRVIVRKEACVCTSLCHSRVKVDRLVELMIH